MEKYSTEKNYYENYGDGFDATLSLMNERLRSMKISEDVLKRLNVKEVATLLTLGSATPRNLFHLGQIDKYFRPGKVEQDKAIIVDQNLYPLKKHREDILVIEGKDGWSNMPKSTPEFPYPKFELIQADMRDLPFTDQTMDITISDYTLNFLDKPEDIDKTFEEISRTLSTEGIVLMSFMGNEKYPFKNENQRVAKDNIHDIQERALQGGTKFYYFPLESYFDAAKRYGLETIAINNLAKTDICAAFIKAKQENPYKQ
jgi:SAM-dependent methyltransferase